MRRIFPTRGSVIVGPTKASEIGVLGKMAQKDPNGLYLKFRWRHGLRNVLRIRRVDRWDPERSEWTTERGGGHNREAKDETVHAGLKAVEELAKGRGAKGVRIVTGINVRKLPEGWYEGMKPVRLMPGMWQRVYGKRFKSAAQ